MIGSTALFWAGLVGVASATEPDWSTVMGERPRALLPTDAGGIVVALGDALLGIDPTDGSERWRRPRREGASRDLLHPVPGTQLFVASAYAPALGPPVFEVIDALSGTTRWADSDGLWQLGLYREPHSDDLLAVVAADDRLETVAVFRVDVDSASVVWTAQEGIAGVPVLSAVHPGERCDAWTVRGSAGPLFVPEGVVTRWSPVDGIVLRDWETGELRWRLLPPTHDKVLPVLGAADLVADSGVLYALLSERELVAIRLETGELLWQPRRLRGSISGIAVSAPSVVVAAVDTVEGLTPSTGRRQWRHRIDSERVVDLVADEDTAYVLDELGGVTALATGDGSVRWRRTVSESDLDAVHRLVVREAGVAVLLRSGVALLDSKTGAVRWQVAAPTVGDLSGRGLQAPKGARSGAAAYGTGDLYREAPTDPARSGRYLWESRERVDRSLRVVLHRTDLDTGEDARVVMPSDTSEWVVDAALRTVVGIGYGGALRGWHFEPADEAGE